MDFRSRIPGKYLFRLVDLKRRFGKGFGEIYYSQSGEDVILKGIFRKQDEGFFVDVGAFHPEHYSNTYLLYEKGWSGINIEPNPESIRLFKRDRPRDTNLNMGVAREEKNADYYIFNHQSYNTFSPERKVEWEQKSFLRLVKTVNVPCRPLGGILKEHFKGKTIDLFNVDVEGGDVEVLESNDWNLYRPKVVVIEESNFDFENPQKSAVYSFLTGKSYRLHASTGLSLIFVDVK